MSDEMKTEKSECCEIEGSWRYEINERMISMKDDLPSIGADEKIG
jgi:hypothetical protein